MESEKLTRDKPTANSGTALDDISDSAFLLRAQRQEMTDAQLSEESTQRRSRRSRIPTMTPPATATIIVTTKTSSSTRGLVSDYQSMTEVEEIHESQQELPIIKEEGQPHTDRESTTRTSSGDTVSLPNPRGQWANQLECILSVLGAMVGYGNIWRFPQMTAQSGGGAFIIPYLVFLLLVGIPLTYFEMSLGQYSSFGPTGVFDNVAPIFQGLGWALLLTNVIVTVYYNCLSAWSLFYLFASLQKTLPWYKCEHEWNTALCFSHADNDSCHNSHGKDSFYFNHSCHSNNESDVYEQYLTGRHNHTFHSPAHEYFFNRIYERSSGDAGIQGYLNLCLLLAWVLTLLLVFRGVRSMGLFVYFTTLFPYLAIIVLIVYDGVQQGAAEGIAFYLNFKFESLTDVNVWSSAALQVVYSLNLSLGTLIVLASYNRFRNNCLRDAVITCWLDTLASAGVGFFIFPALGYIAQKDNLTVQEVINETNDTALVFVVVSRVVSHFPVAPAWSFFVFTTVLVIGLSSQSVMVEEIVTVLCDQFPILFERRWLVAAVVCAVLYALGTPLCTKRGYILLGLFDTMSSYPLTYCGFFQLVCCMYVYGVDRFKSNLTEMFSQPRSLWAKVLGRTGRFWFITWKWICPAILLAAVVVVPYYSLNLQSIYGTGGSIFGWFLAFAPLFVLISVASVRLVRSLWLKKSIRALLRPTCLWCPLHERLIGCYSAPSHRTARLDLTTQ